MYSATKCATIFSVAQADTVPLQSWQFRVRGEATETLELDIFDTIGEGFFSGGVTPKAVRSALRDAKQTKSIVVRIDSAGGDVTEGIAIYNLLRQHGASVTVHVEGLAASIASVIAMAGDDIVMAEGAFMMIHNPWGLALGDADAMRHHADVLDKMRDELVGIYVARTGQKREDVLAAVNAETWMTADEAMALGYATKVIPAKKKRKAAAAWNLANFTRVPDAVRAYALGIKSAPTISPPELENETVTPEGVMPTEKPTPTAVPAAPQPRGASSRLPLTATERHREIGAKLDASLPELAELSSDEVLGAVTAWYSASSKAVERMNEMEAREEQRRVEQEREQCRAMIVGAVKAGKMSPAEAFEDPVAQTTLAPEWAEMPIGRLRANIERRPVFTAPPKQPAGQAGGLTDRELAKCKAKRIDPEVYLANKIKMAARSAPAE